MSPIGLTPSEQFVASLCRRSFLKLWTHPNPKGKKGKELCDCLIVCGPHIVIISVKENEYRETGDEIGWERWIKVAIEKSASQIWGAERWLETAECFERNDGRIIALPPQGSRQYHRVAVALGAHGKVMLKWGDLGHGFVHVCDEYSVGVIFSVLDTITDFVKFLSASESLVSKGVFPFMMGGGIENLVALYLLWGRSFEFEDAEHAQPDMLVLHDDLWDGVAKSDEFKQMLNDLKDSYIWDRLIEHYAEDLLTGGMFDMHKKEVTENELALVAMALQPRGCRANLVDAFMEFLQNEKLKSAARVVQGDSGYAFVFTIGSSEDREFRSRELMLRCLVVRGRFPNIQTVVGIATDRPEVSETGYSSDIVYIHMPEWTEESELHVQGIQNDLGYFKDVSWCKQA